MNAIHPIDTSLGPVQAAFNAAGEVVYLGFSDHEHRAPLLSKLGRLALDLQPDAQAVGRLREQLEDYATGGRRVFDIPVRLHGSPFEGRVWRLLQDIPFGETRSYGQLAAALGDPNLSRAVGRANGANPVSILIPCHRVIGANGSLTGYAGGLARKERLLRIEGALRA